MTEDRKKYIEQWWRKYEAMSKLDEEFPPSRESLFDLINSLHQHLLNSGNISTHLEEDVAHHTRMQEIFQKWEQVHGSRI